MRELSYDELRDRVVKKAAKKVLRRCQAAGIRIDFDDIVQEIWVWVFAANGAGNCGDDRLRIHLAPDSRNFNLAVHETALNGWEAVSAAADNPQPLGALPVDRDGNELDPDEALEAAARPTGPGSGMAGWNPFNPVVQALQDFPTVEQQILTLAASGLNATQIGEALNLKPATVRTRKRRALERLRSDPTLLARTQDYRREMAESRLSLTPGG